MPTFKLFVSTVPSRTGTVLPATLASVAAGDWGEAPDVFVQAAGPEDKDRCVTSYADLLRRAAGCGADFAVVLEDDVDVSPHLRHNLTNWSRLPGLKVGSLYLPTSQRDVVAWTGGGADYDERKVSEVLVPGHRLWGAQGMVYAVRDLPLFLTRYDMIRGLRDYRTYAAAGRLGWGVQFYKPAQVQHRVGHETTAESRGHYHTDETFDPGWEHPGAAR